MPDTKKDFELCSDAQSLLAELGGIDESKSEYKRQEALREMDDWRVRLVECVHYLVSAFKTAWVTDPKQKDNSDIRKLVDIFGMLSEVPSDDGTFLIRYRGIKLDADPSVKSRELDYVVSLGALWIDIPMAQDITRRQLVESSDLTERLSSAFRRLAAMRLFTVQLDLSNWSSKNLHRMSASIRYLSSFLSSSPGKLTLEGEKLIDPNLYVLAALNGLRGEKLQQLVNYVHKMKSHPKTSKALAQYASTFDAIFAFKKLKAQLVKPAIEVNNIIYLELLRDCFDKNGRFIRRNFEKHIPQFARWEKTAFKYLWRDLKSIMHRRDRIDYLNSLRIMIHHINNPRNPFDLLIRDFCDITEGIKFSDRNAIMLTSILIFRYDEHIRFDIELTPGEVFAFKADAKPAIAEKARAYLDGDGADPFLNKIDIVKRGLNKSLDADKGDTDVMSLPYTISLLREIYIFLTLVGGVTAHKTLRSALEEYGNPEAKIYTRKRSQDSTKALIQLLQITIRGLGRLGHKEDLGLFQDIRRNGQRFIGLKPPKHPDLGRHTDLVRMAMHYLDELIP